MFPWKSKKWKGGPFGVKFALGGLGLRCCAQDCKKWTDQCEDCSLKKKKGHCYSRAFFLKRKTRRLKTSHERPKWPSHSKFKRVSFFKYAKGHYTVLKLPEGVRIRRKNHFSPTGNNKKPILKNFERSCIVPKTLRSPLWPQNVSFLVKIEGGRGSYENKFKKNSRDKILLSDSKCLGEFFCQNYFEIKKL